MYNKNDSFNWINKNIENEFIELFLKWFDKDLLGKWFYERYYIIWKYSIYASSMQGDFVEAGVYNGSSAFFMSPPCKTKLHLIDSWEGLPALQEIDNPIYDRQDNEWLPRFNISIDAAKENLKSYSNIEYHKGWIPEVLSIKDPISLLHLDLDLYQPTKYSLEYFWDQMVPGGIIVSDLHDEVSWGASKATKDFFKDIRQITFLPTGKAIIIK
jgi:hypothetical protein